MKKARKAAKLRTPQSFEDALKQGWKVEEQLSAWNFRHSNKREGFLRLVKAKSGKTLMVRYSALYDFGTPYFF